MTAFSKPTFSVPLFSAAVFKITTGTSVTAAAVIAAALRTAGMTNTKWCFFCDFDRCHVRFFGEQLDGCRE